MKLVCNQCGHNGIPATRKNNFHISAYCMECDVFIKHLPQQKLDNDFVLYFGKYKGRNVRSLVGSTTEEFQYLQWLKNNGTNLKEFQRQILNEITK